MAEVPRRGDWQGGPEPVSGKLRSGIVSWWRWSPQTPQAGVPFELRLRLEEIRADDAQVALATSDGARLGDAGAPSQWLLKPGQPAELALVLVAPPGDSYLHVTTRQAGRSSVRSIRLALPPDGVASAPSASRRDYAVDANGQPIVRMPARP